MPVFFKEWDDFCFDNPVIPGRTKCGKVVAARAKEAVANLIAGAKLSIGRYSGVKRVHSLNNSLNQISGHVPFYQPFPKFLVAESRRQRYKGKTTPQCIVDDGQ